MLRVALVGDSDRGDFKLQVVRRILGALDVGTLGAIREHAAVPATAVRNVFVGFRTTERSTLRSAPAHGSTLGTLE